MAGIDNTYSRLFAGMRTSSTGLAAERMRIDVIARNIANANSTSTPEGGPYRRRTVSFSPLMQKDDQGKPQVTGVSVTEVGQDHVTPFEVIHDPSHPDADADGNVSLPNVNATKEMADLITAMRSYDANLRAQQSLMRMAERALELAR